MGPLLPATRTGGASPLRVARHPRAIRQPSAPAIVPRYSCLVADDPFTGGSELDLELRRREERRAVEEGGGGESEGFELAEAELIEHASHGDDHAASRILQDAGLEPVEEQIDSEYGEADTESKPD